MRHLFARLRLLCWFFSVLLLAVGAGATEALRIEKLTIESAAEEHVFRVEIARTEPQRARGLMFREAMAPDAGMLFIFEMEGERYFWMKNTPLSLDIIFLDASGAIVSIAENTTPFSEKTVSSHGASLYVLEVLAGTSKRLGISVGGKVRTKAIDSGG